jgi:hypothetical protein
MDVSIVEACSALSLLFSIGNMDLIEPVEFPGKTTISQGKFGKNTSG